MVILRSRIADLYGMERGNPDGCFPGCNLTHIASEAAALYHPDPVMVFRICMLVCVLAAATLRAQEPLPKKGPEDRLDFEPKLMLDGPNAPKLSGTVVMSPEDQVSKCQADLVKAEQRAADAEQLFKEGILAKVEAEGRFLRVVFARKALADAQALEAIAHQQAVAKSFAAHAASQADLDSANAAIKTTGTTAAAADAEWSKAQLDAALLDLQRKRKLYSEGAGTRHEVEMAEDRVTLLSGTAPP